MCIEKMSKCAIILDMPSLERSITMNTYQTFEEYIYDKYYDAIYNKIKNFVFGNETHRCSRLNSLQMSLLLNWMIIV